MHVSLDGFVAGPNGEMDWIMVDEQLFDFASQRTHQSDLALYARKTFEMMEGYWPTAADQPNPSKHDIEHSNWYKQVNKVVLSRTLKGKSIPKTQIISDNVVEEVRKLKQSGEKEIIIFGSPSASHLLLNENLVDELWLFVNPVLIGQGLPMFKGIQERKKLKLIKSEALLSGVICLHYEKI